MHCSSTLIPRILYHGFYLLLIKILYGFAIMYENINIKELLKMIAVVVDLLSTLLQFLRDRSNLRINLDFEPRTGKGAAFKVYLVNKGRRPVSVNEVFLRMKSNEDWYPISSTFPIKLDESEDKSIPFPLDEVRGKFTPLDVRKAVAKDTTGKQYADRLSRQTKKKIRKHVKN